MLEHPRYLDMANPTWCRALPPTPAENQYSLPGIFLCPHTVAAQGAGEETGIPPSDPAKAVSLCPHPIHQNRSSSQSHMGTRGCWTRVCPGSKPSLRPKGDRGNVKPLSVSCNTSFSRTIQNKHRGCSNRTRAAISTSGMENPGHSGRGGAHCPQEESCDGNSLSTRPPWGGVSPKRGCAASPGASCGARRVGCTLCHQGCLFCSRARAEIL